MNKEVLRTLVNQLLNDDYGITQDAYVTLYDIVEYEAPELLNEIINRVGACEGRVYLREDVDI